MFDLNPCFSFSGCGSLFPYHLGVAKQLYDSLGENLNKCVFAGSSGGAVAATLLALNIDPEIYANNAFQHRQFLNPIKTFTNILDESLYLFDICNKKNDDIIEKINNRCQITVTQLPFFRQIDITHYKNIDELKNWLCATCTWPILGRWLPTIVNSGLYIDGCVSCMQPKWKYDRATITISVVDRNNSDIYPSIPLHKLHAISNITEKDCYQIYRLGITDCANWLETNRQVLNNLLINNDSRALIKNI